MAERAWPKNQGWQGQNKLRFFGVSLKKGWDKLRSEPPNNMHHIFGLCENLGTNCFLAIRGHKNRFFAIFTKNKHFEVYVAS